MDDRAPTYDELFELTRRQARQLDELRAAVERLKAEWEQAQRAGQRQAAPFSKGAPKPHPKPPGRQAGHPPSHRAAPPPEPVDRTIAVPLPANGPECRGPLDDAPVTVHDQDPIALPEPKPVLTRFRIPVARCPACYRRVQGRHPELTSDALGAAAVPYGPRLLGVAADRKHRLGVSDRKCSSVLVTLAGLVVASAALVRGGHRLRRLARPSDDRRIEAARHSAVPHVDETGGKIGGRSAWLWVFADAHATLDRIRRSRGHEVIVEVLGEDDQGVLVSDWFLADDPLNFPKSKCSAHLLQRGSEVEQSQSRGRCGSAAGWRRGCGGRGR
jgi:transposase